MTTDSAITSELNGHYPISKESVSFYKENGYIKLRQVISPQLLEHYRQAITAKVAELSINTVLLEKRTTYGKAFLQVENLWTQSNDVREFVLGTRLARIAAELMEVRGVRLYHDQALYKEAGGGITPWHADQYYWPIGGDKAVTAWVPLQATPIEMGP